MTGDESVRWCPGGREGAEDVGDVNVGVGERVEADVNMGLLARLTVGGGPEGALVDEDDTNTPPLLGEGFVAVEGT